MNSTLRIMTGLIFIGLGIVGTIFLIHAALSQVPHNVDCFDRYGNKIVGLTCEEQFDNSIIALCFPIGAIFGIGLVFINIVDREGKLVTFTSGEIKLIKERGE